MLKVYEAFGRGQSQQALALVEALVKDHPNFHLAQLVRGDLLAARLAPTRGDAAGHPAPPATQALSDLRDEARLRLVARRERPLAGTVPAQFLAVSPRSRYAIAVDTSRSRLYLLRNSATGLQLVADYYVSVGKSGVDKEIEGDARTPLGVYHVTSNLDPKSLRDFYGAGALPINYPNPYDQRQGKTGSGIWLHGTPPDQFARAPQSTDGCVVMANADLLELLGKVEVGATPVVIARSLKWISPQQAKTEAQGFDRALQAWREARTRGDMNRLQSFYLPEFQRTGRDRKLQENGAVLQGEIRAAQGRSIQVKELSYLHWKDSSEFMVASFGEVAEGETTGNQRRQYWLKQGADWKLLREDVRG